MNNYKKIENIMNENNGILYVKDLEKYNIHRQYVKILEERGTIEKIAKGIYIKKGKYVSEFFILNQKYKTGIFSHNTALYFYGLTDRTPFLLDMTFPSTVRINNDSLSPHYIKPELLSLGETVLSLEDGTKIKIYDKERTICDIIRDRNKIDPQIFNTAIKEYFKQNNKNLNLLYKYAKKLKIDKILKKYMEVLD
ncbi:MAG: hypothetical protein E7313_08035 [Clostridiales bacterium]|nr:hypothetical protein [Clostridiales bacterium]